MRVGTSYGIEALVRLTNSTATADLSSEDGERVQGNAAEALVNATRNDRYGNNSAGGITVAHAHTFIVLIPRISRIPLIPLIPLILFIPPFLPSHENAERIRSCGVRPIVLMCTSTNLVVQRAAPLVLGNIAQNDAIRSEVGR